MPSPVVQLAGIPSLANRQVILDLLETRLLIEPRLAALASKRGALADVRKLQAALDRVAAIVDGPDDDLEQTNMGFHRDIAVMSGSPVAASVIESLVDTYGTEQQMILRVIDHRQDLEQHREILDYIRAGDPTGAEQHMRAHLAVVRETVDQRIHFQ